MRRLELPTSTSRTWRASQLCYIPFNGRKNTALFALSQIKPPPFFKNFNKKICTIQKSIVLLQPLNKNDGAIAQSVEQRTENPCVPGSIPGGTTTKRDLQKGLFFFTYNLWQSRFIGLFERLRIILQGY